MKRIPVVWIMALCLLFIVSSLLAVINVVEEQPTILLCSAGGRPITHDQSGRLWCAYSVRPSAPSGIPDMNIRVAYSDDNGSNWTHKWLTGANGPLWQAWPLTGDQKYPTVLVDSARRQHFIWASNSVDESVLHHAIHEPGSWETTYFTKREVVTYDSHRDIVSFSAALDSQDRVHLAWIQKLVQPPGTQNHNVFYASYSGGMNGSWSDKLRIRPASDRNQLSPSVAVDLQDNIFIAYHVEKDGVDSVKLYLVDSDTLESVTNTPSLDQIQPCLAAGQDGNLHIIWRGKSSSGGSTYMLYYRRRDADGGWNPREKVGIDGQNYNAGSIATDFDGNVYIFCQGTVPTLSGWHIVGSEKYMNDTTWSEPGVYDSTTSGDIPTNPRIAHALWPMNDGGPVCIPKKGWTIIYEKTYNDNDQLRAWIHSELTWLGDNYAELRIIPPLTGGFTYGPGEQINLEWRVYPDDFEALSWRGHDIYFGLWLDPVIIHGTSVDKDSISLGGPIYLYKGRQNGWAGYEPPIPAWQDVRFPLSDGSTSGILPLMVPGTLSNNRWAFMLAIVDRETGSFIAGPEIACSQYFWVE